MMPTLSITVITKNEEANIRQCLESVKWADEIVVVDSGSTDGTLAICREYTDKVFAEQWLGYGPQKNRALDYATGEWVLSLDADERVTLQLKEEIEKAMVEGACSAYRVPRLSSYCGRYMRHSGWWPDHVLRLFKRGTARFSNARVHEQVETAGKIGTLASPLLHQSFSNFEQVLHKVNQYSTESACMLAARGKRASLSQAIFHAVWAFCRTYLLRRGFLDGRHGFLLAVSNAEGTYYRYVKLWYLQQRDSCSTPTGGTES